MKKLKIRNWTSCIQDRSKWKLYVEKAKRFKNVVVVPKEEKEEGWEGVQAEVSHYAVSSSLLLLPLLDPTALLSTQSLNTSVYAVLSM
jgi:hypothetical protein